MADPSLSAHAGVPAQRERPHAGRMAQARALASKSLQLQRRNVRSNACLVAAPILFCILLLALQFSLNRLMTGSEFQCGCQCTQCCFDVDPSNCTVQTDSPCAHTCLQRNASNCGLQFSVGAQAAACSIAHPSTWPPILQSPPEEQRAAPYRPRVTFVYAAGADAPLSDRMTASLLQQPALQASALLAVDAYLRAFTSDITTYTLPGEALTMLGLTRLGSTSRLPQQGGLNFETALVGNARNLHMLWAEGTCARLGLAGAANISLTTALQALVNASNAPSVATLLNGRLQDLTGSAASSSGTGSGSGVAKVASLQINCTDTVLARARDSAAMRRALYCGYASAHCMRNATTNSFAAGFDWAGTRAAPAPAFAPVIYYNDSYGIPDDGADVGTNYMRTPQLLNMAVNGWMKALLGSEASVELIGLGALPKPQLKLELDFTTVVGPVLACWVLQLLLPVFVDQLVYEKERRLRMVMKMHGLGDGAYVAVHAAWFMALYLVYAAAFLAFGHICGLNLFMRNAAGIQIVLYVLWGAAMVSLAFVMSALFSSARTATVAAYLFVFASGLLGYMLVRYLLDLGGRAWWAVFLQFLPPLALYRGLYELGSYAYLGAYRGGAGMTAAHLWDGDNGMLAVWAILAAQAALLMALAWYLDQVCASGTGNRRHPLFFLGYPRAARRTRAQHEAGCSNALQMQALPTAQPGMCSSQRALGTGGASLMRQLLRAAGVHAGSCSSLDASATGRPRGVPEAQLQLAPAEPADVAVERRRVEALSASSCCVSGGHPLVVRALHKVYPAQDGQPPKLAVQRLDLAVRTGECFGLLGPNGAGKSTAISMLTGLVEPSSGSALIDGLDVKGDMPAIHKIMGVCPQHDLLWAALSGREHLQFYGRLKGLSGPELDATVHRCLAAVRLWGGGIADKPSGAYSGGMQRRLSVAIALMGNPAVVYLDEPSTGLDPASRRTLWEVVRGAKAGRAIVLTTHSMEEAEVLCDRLGIFVAGRLACVGTPKEITSRFCGFLLLTVTVPAEAEAAAHALVAALAPSAALTYSVGGTLKFEMPLAEVSLGRVFAAMTGPQAAALGVVDWCAANAGLEDTFIRFARSTALQPSV